MEYLEDNLEEWLGGELEAYGDDDYLIFDCPGQIELYSHLSVFRTFVEYLKRDGWQICVVSQWRLCSVQCPMCGMC
jgi:GTPase SAR1 family protein